ncbi:hypothetical protein RX327_32080 [Bradyrhizobium sp. BEA-2-5]|uniref:hypothetical protein n=1 Tax=Bradyrhizobium sp. BEA-2-5 TaxID=3080015 RepID=UPI00293F13CC|nr:hypothetical protein [Bradyrhizobium sp. BEA-2-5]WOH80397.1 hypothetical protein RX327_32080 [Bradyrhizobium sp. BEA-2-5]
MTIVAHCFSEHEPLYFSQACQHLLLKRRCAVYHLPYSVATELHHHKGSDPSSNRLDTALSK